MSYLDVEMKKNKQTNKKNLLQDVSAVWLPKRTRPLVAASSAGAETFRSQWGVSYRLDCCHLFGGVSQQSPQCQLHIPLEFSCTHLGFNVHVFSSKGSQWCTPCILFTWPWIKSDANWISCEKMLSWCWWFYLPTVLHSLCTPWLQGNQAALFPVWHKVKIKEMLTKKLFKLCLLCKHERGKKSLILFKGGISWSIRIKTCFFFSL